MASGTVTATSPNGRTASLEVRKMWIAWEDDSSIRSPVLANELGAVYRAFTRFTRGGLFGWLRYPVATVQTLWSIVRGRPDLLVVQNPSILLAFEAAVLRPLLGYRLVIDLHTPFLDPSGLSRLVADFLHGYGLRHCDAVIVTNDAFRQKVLEQTSKPVFVLPDKIPEVGVGAGDVPLQGSLTVLYICTFSIDEPWAEVVEAARDLPDDVRIYISGRSPIGPDEVPPNVVLTGYLPRDRYENLLRSVDAVMVLTTAEDNLVCGGYEAVAAGKPLILSDTRALRALFQKGTVFTENTRTAIARTIDGLRTSGPALAADIAVLRGEMMADWDRRWRAILAELDVPHTTAEAS